jgi:DNA ligase-1
MSVPPGSSNAAVPPGRHLGRSRRRSRNAKRDLIAGLLAETGPDDVEIVVSYLSGSLRQRRTGVGWRSLQTLPRPAGIPSLEVAAVDAAFERISELQGVGSSAARAAAVAELFANATSAEQDFLRGLVFGDLRQGALEAQVQEGLAAALGMPLAVVRRAAMLLSTAAAARWRSTADLRRSRRSSSSRHRRAADARCKRPGPGGAVIKVGLPAVVDYKLDGVQSGSSRRRRS